MYIGSAPSSASRHITIKRCLYIVFVSFFSLVGVTWTYCYNASSFTVFRNGAFLKTVLGKTTTTEVSGTYYVVANVINATSGPSNVVVVV